MSHHIFVKLALSLTLLCSAPSAMAAQDSKAPPFWGSLKKDEVNMRAGPGEDYRISHIYRRKGLPIKVLREMEIWRLVEDPSGARGWMMVRFITRERSAMVIGKEPADMRESPDNTARLKWRLSAGITGKLGDCASGWCHLDIGGRAGYVRQARLWGAGAL